MSKKVVYLSGPITGVENYQEAFERAEEMLAEAGFTVLNPAKLPKGLTNEQYMRIDLAMIDAADVVYFLPGWENSKGSVMERAYCEYIGRETV